MYNKDQKARYLKYCSCVYEPETVKLMERIFNSTEMAENQFDKDACDFNQIEVIDFLKGLDSKSRRRLKSTVSRLSKYYEWSKNEEHLTNNIINPFDGRGIENIIDGILPKEDLNKKYFTKEQFIEMKDEIIDVSNQFIAYAFYCGLTLNELVNLKIGDLNNERNKIFLSITNRELFIDSSFSYLMTSANDQTQYFADGIEKESRTKAYDYIDSGYVIKSCRTGSGSIVSNQYITTRMRVIKEQMGNDFISIPTLQLNGLINHIKERYSEKGIDLKTAILHMINGKLYTYDKETQGYIKEFGSKKTIRFLRMDIEAYLDFL